MNITSINDLLFKPNTTFEISDVILLLTGPVRYNMSSSPVGIVIQTEPVLMFVTPDGEHKFEANSGYFSGGLYLNLGKAQPDVYSHAKQRMQEVEQAVKASGVQVYKTYERMRPISRVGEEVKPMPRAGNRGPKWLASGSTQYESAVVIQIEPSLVLVSMSCDMRWGANLNPDDYMAIGLVDSAQLKKCMELL